MLQGLPPFSELTVDDAVDDAVDDKDASLFTSCPLLACNIPSAWC